MMNNWSIQRQDATDQGSYGWIMHRGNVYSYPQVRNRWQLPIAWVGGVWSILTFKRKYRKVYGDEPDLS